MTIRFLYNFTTSYFFSLNEALDITTLMLWFFIENSFSYSVLLFWFLGSRKWRFLTVFHPYSWQPGDQGDSHGQVQGRGARTQCISRTAFKFKVTVTTDLPFKVSLRGLNRGSRRCLLPSDTTRKCSQQPDWLPEVQPHQ